MSQTPTGSGNLKPSDEYLSAWTQLAQMIQEGRSFSGRERNCCFLNTGGPRFADVSAATGLDFDDDGRSVAVADWDHDGDLDLWVANRTSPRVRFIRNDVAQTGGHVTLELVGDPSRGANRDALGAQVEIQLGGSNPRKLIKSVVAGDGFLSQSSRRIHFGLGALNAKSDGATIDGAKSDGVKIERVTVRWPTSDKPIETFTGIEANGRYRLVQGTGRAVSLAAPPRNLTLKPAPLTAPAETSVAHIKLVEPLPIDPFEYVDLNGQTIRSTDLVGAPALINFWSTSCAPCVKELREFGTEKAALDRLKVRIVALNVDALSQSEPPTAESLKRALARLDYPFDAGLANKQLLDQIDQFQRRVVYRQRTLPLPLSVLIDPAGRGTTIYFGPVEPRVLLADVLDMAADPTTQRHRAAPFAGRWARDLFESHPIAVASSYLEGGYSADARAYIDKYLSAESAPPSIGTSREATNRNLRVADMRHMLGRIAEAEGKPLDAIAEYRRALEYHADHTGAIMSLAWILATSTEDQHRSGAQAVKLAEPLAAGIGKHDANILDTLAAAYAEAGRFADAQRTAESALAIARAKTDAALTKAIETRLALYAANKPYRANGPRDDPAR